MTRTFGRLKAWQWGIVLVWAVASAASSYSLAQFIGALIAAYVVVFSVTLAYRKLQAGNVAADETVTA